MVDSLEGLENSLNYHFKDKTLLEKALTHRSVGSRNNERLEYLGDSLLGFIIAENLYSRFEEATEGELTRLRASLVKGETLAKLARKIELGEFVKLGPGEKRTGGWRRVSILANTLEAIIGAIYLDSDFNTCRMIVLNIYSEFLDNTSLKTLEKDPKTRLQEYLQARKLGLPSYKIVAEEGAAHEKSFSIECEISDLDIHVRAAGRSKRIAEQAAADIVLKIIHSQ